MFVCYGSLIARKEFGGQSWFHFSSFLYSFCSFIIALILPCSYFFLIFHYIFTNITIKKKITNPTQKSGSKSKYAIIKNKEKSMYNFFIIKKNPFTKLKKKKEERKIRLSFLLYDPSLSKSLK